MNKIDLLKLNFVEDNEFLDQYINLINSNLGTKKEKYKTQQHHVIPKCFYKRRKESINNFSNNLVNLTYSNHILAHYYLSLCVKDKEIKKDCIIALIYLINRIDIVKEKENDNLRISCNLNYEQLIKMLPRLQELYQQETEYRSERMKGKEPWNKGKKWENYDYYWINNGSISKRVRAQNLQEYLSLGWIKGRHNQEYINACIRKASAGRAPHNKGKTLTEEQKQHLRQINLGKKQTLETIEKRRKRLIGHKGNKGKIWITNGTINKVVYEEDFISQYQPQGYYRGITKTKKYENKS